MTQEERLQHQIMLQQCCDEWKELLSLHEWNIRVHIYDAEDKTPYDTTKAMILRNTGQAYFPFSDKQLQSAFIVHNEEVNLVLCLLQVRLEMVNNEDKANEVYYQRALYILANTLVNLKNDSNQYKAFVEEFNAMYGDNDGKQKEKTIPDKMEQSTKKAPKFIG